MIKLFGKMAVVLSILFTVGCQTPYQGQTLFSLPATDNSLAVRVNDAIRADKHLANLPIQVQISEGVVNLSGYVKTIRQSDTAAEIASKVSGVKSVQNSLIVRK